MLPTARALMRPQVNSLVASTVPNENEDEEERVTEKQLAFSAD